MQPQIFLLFDHTQRQAQQSVKQSLHLWPYQKVKIRFMVFPKICRLWHFTDRPVGPICFTRSQQTIQRKLKCSWKFYFADQCVR